MTAKKGGKTANDNLGGNIPNFEIFHQIEEVIIDMGLVLEFDADLVNVGEGDTGGDNGLDIGSWGASSARGVSITCGAASHWIIVFVPH